MASLNPRITVAICTRNRPELLSKAVPTILPQLGDVAELLIIDNGSTDRTVEVAAGFANGNAGVRVFREEKLGISRARNAALQNARGEWVLFFDDDERANPGWIAKYVSFFDRHAGEKIGCVGGGYEPEFDAPPPRWFNVERARFYVGPNEVKMTGPSSPWAGNCAYYRKAALELGGFSVELPRAEDTDMNMRLQAAGYDVWWLPDAAIIHCLPTARMTLKALARISFLEGRSYGRLRLRHFKGGAIGVYRGTRILIAPLQGGFLLLMGLLAWPLKGGKITGRSWQRGSRALGIGWQMLVDGFGKG